IGGDYGHSAINGQARTKGLPGGARSGRSRAEFQQSRPLVKDEFTNRMGMFKTSLTTLNSATNKPVWLNQPPVVFTTKVADAGVAVTELEAFCTAQESKTAGAAEQKDREAKEAEEVGFQMARGLVEWCRDQGDETNAAKVDLSRSKWHGLRDESFKNQLDTTISLAQGVTGGAQAVAAVDYGITAPKVTTLAKEIK